MQRGNSTEESFHIMFSYFYYICVFFVKLNMHFNPHLTRTNILCIVPFSASPGALCAIPASHQAKCGGFSDGWYESVGVPERYAAAY